MSTEKLSFNQYLQKLKQRRTEDNYRYTDEDFDKHLDYINECYNNERSVYKCLEFMSFAGKDKELSLEDVAENYVNAFEHGIVHPRRVAKKAFINGYNHATKELYSEEEVLKHLNILYSMKNSTLDTFVDKNGMITNEWFNLNKK